MSSMRNVWRLLDRNFVQTDQQCQRTKNETGNNQQLDNTAKMVEMFKKLNKNLAYLIITSSC